MRFRRRVHLVQDLAITSENVYTQRSGVHDPSTQGVAEPPIYFAFLKTIFACISPIIIA